MEKICKYCGSVFESRGTAHKFCSEDCKYFNAKETGSKSHNIIKPKGILFNRVCAYCGKSFDAAHGKQKYCSNECLVAYGSDKLKAQRAETKPPCKQCGNTLPSNRHMYCSNECRYKANHKENVFRMTEEIAKQRIESRRGNVEHVRGHNGRGKITVRCKECKTVFDVDGQILRKDYQITCPACLQSKREAEQQIISERKEYNALALQQRREEREQQERDEWELKSMKLCKECGEPFKARHLGLTYCSDRCKRKSLGHANKISKRLKKYGCGPGDRDITLNRLIKRDGGICHICKKGCDKKDKHINEMGYTVVGPMYPSIDHVKPLSKGGAHTWDNVRLAHCYCNSIKSDNAVYESPGGQLVMAV